MTDEIIEGELESMTVADAVLTDDAEMLFREGTPRDDYTLSEFGVGG